MKKILITLMMLALVSTSAYAEKHIGDWIVVNGNYVGTTWSTNFPYKTGDLCSSGSTVYISLQDNNTGHAVTDSSWWLAVGGLPSGTLGDILQHDGNSFVAQAQINGLINDTAGDGDVNSVWSADKNFDELALRANIANVLELDNTNTFTPDQDYEPATKKYVDDSGSGTGYVTPPTYSNETCTLGEYSWDGSYYYGCETTDQWDRFAVTWAAWDNPAPILYTLTITDPGNNDAITCADSDLSVSINCGNGNTNCAATAIDSASITGMTAVPDTGREFTIWTGDITSTENPTTTPLVMSSNRAVGATFDIQGVTCDTQSILYTTAAVQSENTTDIDNTLKVLSDDFIGDGRALYSITLMSGSSVQGTSAVAELYVNTSQDFSGTNVADTTVTTPGATSTEFEGVFSSQPTLENGVTYYYAINDNDVTYPNRFSLRVVNDSGQRYQYSSDGLGGTFTDNANPDKSLWVEVRVCD